MSLYEEMEKNGVEIDSHSSDLYVPVNDTTTEILSKYPLECRNSSVFTSEIDGKRWYDIPFGYSPYWKKRGM
jgi:hypothetical protein